MHDTAAAGTLSPTAFADILTRYRWPLYVFLRNLVADDEQAHDLTQDVFCDAWRACLKSRAPLVPGGDDDAIRRWLFHTAYCRAISVLRRRRLVRWESLDAETLEDVTAPPIARPIEDQVVEAEVVRAALAALAPDDAACLLLSVVHAFTVAEIAQVVGISFEAAKKRLSRAKQRLRTAYLTQNPPAQEGQHE